MKNIFKYIADKLVTTLFVGIAVFIAASIYNYLDKKEQDSYQEHLDDAREYKNPEFIVVKSINPTNIKNTFGLNVTVHNKSDKEIEIIRIGGHLIINGARINKCYLYKYNAGLRPQDTKTYTAECAGTQATNLPTNLEFEAYVEEVKEARITRQ